jgi:hypothetical protein
MALFAALLVSGGAVAGELAEPGQRPREANLHLNTLLSGAAGPNTKQYGSVWDAAGQTFSIGYLPVVAPFDWRWTYSGPAPVQSGATMNSIIGPSFYVDAEPSSNVDAHGSYYAGLSATVFSKSPTTLANLVGGMFRAERVYSAGANTNPIIGVMGTAQAGDQSNSFNGGAVSTDGIAGGIFTAYSRYQAASNAFDPLDPLGQVGLIGRAVIDNNYNSNFDNVGTAGYVDVESGANNAYGVWAGTGSKNHTTALIGNNYGVYVKDVSGAKNINMALRTGAGTVQFGDNVVFAKKITGGTTIQALGTPIIASVSSGCTGQYSCAGGGSKTYTYKVVAVLASGQTSPASAAVSTTTGFDNLATSGQNNLITWSPVEGAVGGYNIYRTAAGGATTNTTGLIANVAQNVTQSINGNFITPTQPSYADAGAAGDAASPPTTNTTGYFNTPTVGFLCTTYANRPPSPTTGNQACFTDSNTTIWGATIAGGGASNVMAWYNGTNWTVVGI